MTMTENDNDTSERGIARGIVFGILRVLVPLIILAGGAAGAIYLMRTKPQSRQRPPRSGGDLVHVMRVRRSSQPITVQAMGTVLPARRTVLQPRISGEVVEVSPEVIPGGRFQQGQAVLRVDPKDYELIVKQRRGELAKAQHDLKLEMGRQAIAKREFALLGNGGGDAEQDEELVLRKPQLALAQAALTAAEASLEKANLDLERTNIVAPFNAIVLDKRVDLGAQVTPLTPLATLVGTDEYWVQVSVPVDQLKWIQIPRADGETGSGVTILNEAAWPAGASRSGRVTRLVSDIDAQGRMARLLVTVRDPLAMDAPDGKTPTLLIGMYVRVKMNGGTLENVISLPRSVLRDGEKVWILGPDDTLQIREVEVAWRGRDSVLVRGGLQDGDRVITSGLAAPVKGMPLQIEGAKPPAPKVHVLEGLR
jgi:RND family efflux transporter MFP subunit